MMKCHKCGKEFDYTPNVIDDVETWSTGNVRFLKVCDVCHDDFQEALSYRN